MDTSEVRLELINEIMKMDESTLLNVNTLIQTQITSNLPDWQKDLLNERLSLHRDKPNSGAD